MATTVSMPQLGETVTEGTILRWAKQVGDTITEDEVLVEISTDKVDTEVPSPAAGTVLEILVAEGDTVSVGTPLVVIGEEGEGSAPAGEQAAEPETPAAEEPAAEQPAQAPAEQPAQPPAEQQTAEQSAQAPAPQPAEEPAAQAPEPPAQEPAAAATEAKDTPSEPEVDAFFAQPDETERKPNLLSPVVRRLIRENEIDVAQLSGTGEGGRITRKDVEAYLESGGPKESAVAAAEPAAAPAPTEPAAAEPAAPAPAPEAVPAPARQPAPAPAAVAASGPATEEVELDRIRIRTAENMIKAKQTAAHVWTSVEVDYEAVERVRQAHKDKFKSEEGFSLTYLPFISRAVKLSERKVRC